MPKTPRKATKVGRSKEYYFAKYPIPSDIKTQWFYNKYVLARHELIKRDEYLLVVYCDDYLTHFVVLGVGIGNVHQRTQDWAKSLGTQYAIWIMGDQDVSIPNTHRCCWCHSRIWGFTEPL